MLRTPTPAVPHAATPTVPRVQSTLGPDDEGGGDGAAEAFTDGQLEGDGGFQRPHALVVLVLVVAVGRGRDGGGGGLGTQRGERLLAVKRQLQLQGGGGK